MILKPCSLGVDISDIKRFSNSRHLSKFIKRFHVSGNTAKDAAKTWACLESIIKAEPGVFDPTDIVIEFPKNASPTVHDPKQVLKYHYQLSVSHERALVIAVALGTLKVD